MALLEVGHRKPHKMSEKVRRDLEAELRTHVQNEIGPQRLRSEADQHDQQERHGQNGKEILVVPREPLVHDQLHVERAGECEELQEQGYAQQLRQGSLQSEGALPEVRKTQPLTLRSSLEPSRRSELQRHSGQVRRRFRQRIGTSTESRVVNDQTFPGGPLQNDEMVHVPMEDGRCAQLPELVRAHAQRATAKIELLGQSHQRLQAGPSQRDRVLPP